ARDARGGTQGSDCVVHCGQEGGRVVGPIGGGAALGQGDRGSVAGQQRAARHGQGKRGDPGGFFRNGRCGRDPEADRLILVRDRGGGRWRGDGGRAVADRWSGQCADDRLVIIEQLIVGCRHRERQRSGKSRSKG